MNPDATRSVGPTDSIPPETLDALTDRLDRLESGLCRELASQVERAERAETALTAAQAHAATAAIAAQTAEPVSLRGPSAIEAEPGADRILAFAREEAVRILAEARREADAARTSVGCDAARLREVLVELRCHLVDREAMAAEMVGIARGALRELSRRGEAGGLAGRPTGSDQRYDDGGEDKG